jgi:hypothetical protein
MIEFVPSIIYDKIEKIKKKLSTLHQKFDMSVFFFYGIVDGHSIKKKLNEIKLHNPLFHPPSSVSSSSSSSYPKNQQPPPFIFL